MIPKNAKSLFHQLCIYMDKLDKDEVDASKANAMSKLVGQANNLMNTELKRAALMTNKEFKEQHRNIESTSFDSLNP